MGQAASAAAVLLAAGTPGKRSVLRHAKVTLHQPSSQARGTLPDLAVQAKEVAKVRAEMDEILSQHTGHPVAKIRADIDRDKTFNAVEAVDVRAGRPGHHRPADPPTAAGRRGLTRSGGQQDARRPGAAPGRWPVLKWRRLQAIDRAAPAEDHPVGREVAAPTSVSTSDSSIRSASQTAASTSELASLRPRSSSDR